MHNMIWRPAARPALRAALLASALGAVAIPLVATPALALGPGSTLPPPDATTRGGLVAASSHAASLSIPAGATVAAPLLAGAALPVGAVVAQGTAAINASGSTLDIYQSSQRAIIDWLSFNIGAAGTVNVYMPGASASQLDRVTGTSPIDIEGRLNTPAGGSVFLVDQAGILFGKGATLNVGGLVASTMSIADSAFMAGNYSFARNGATAGVTNQGSIGAANYVALLAPSLVNEGSITTGRMGSVALAAGETVTLTLGNGLTVQVQPATIATLIQNRAMISAPDGTVILTAKALDTLTAQVINTGTIDVADSVATGNGGRVSLFSSGGTTVGGSLIATGGARGGNGGAIETSGGTVTLLPGAVIDAGAPHGKAGSWLLDPFDLTVDATAAAGIEGALNADTSVTLLTSATGAGGPGTTNPAGNGDIIVDAAIAWSTAASLTLSAYRDIDINAAITHSGSAAGLTLTPNTGGGGGDLVFGGSGVVTLGASDNLTIAGNAYTLITDAAQMQAMGLSGYYALANDVDLSSIANFTPIGTVSAGFAGTFEGLAHTLSNLTVNEPTGSYVGLFGDIAGGGTVRDVTLSNVSITGSQYVGALAGAESGTISNVAVGPGLVSGSTGAKYIGGLVGYASSGSISGSYASGSVSVVGDDAIAVGGLVGYADSGSVITASNASGTVSVTGINASSIGGLVGVNVGSILDSSASGNVSVPGSGSEYVGGLVGTTYSLIERSSATGSVTVGDSAFAVGGLAGLTSGDYVLLDYPSAIYTYVSGTVSSSYATGAISAGAGSRSVGGFVGYNVNLIADSYSTGSVAIGGAGTAVGGFAGYSSGTIAAAYATGDVNAGDGSVEVGGFAGMSSGVLVSFGYPCGCYTLVPGTITSSYATGDVSVGIGSQDIGGLVGYNIGTIVASYATGNVTAGAGGQNVGGLVGYNEGTILEGYSTASVTVGDSAIAVGGLVGWNQGDVVSSFASGSAAAGDSAANVGGLVGSNIVGNISAAYATGAVTVGANSQNVGGLVGVDGIEESSDLTGKIADAWSSGGVVAGAGSTGVGGTLGGSAGFLVNDVYWAGDTAGLSAGPGVIALSLSSGLPPTSASSYAGFDFTNTWSIVNGSSLPYMSWQNAGGGVVAPLPPPATPAPNPTPAAGAGSSPTLLASEIASSVISSIPSPVRIVMNLLGQFQLPQLTIGDDAINIGLAADNSGPLLGAGPPPGGGQGSATP